MSNVSNVLSTYYNYILSFFKSNSIEKRLLTLLRNKTQVQPVRVGVIESIIIYITTYHIIINMASTITAQVRFLLSDNPFYSNDELYRLLNANTQKEKTAVRVAKHRVMDKIHNKDAIIALKQQQIPSEPVEHPKEFAEFVKIAFPPFGSLYKWQWDLYRHFQEHYMSLVVVPRDHGKSILITFYIEYMLAVENWDVLLLGWTDRCKQMALFIYTYFVKNDFITDEAVIKNTSNHFILQNGARFDCYGLKEKAILGMHPDIFESKAGLLLVIDDPMDESFEMYPAKERDLENRWASTIANINPNKIIICGTRKFEGDFLEFIAKQYQDTIKLFFRTPWNEDGSLLCPERWTNEGLAQKRAEIGEYRFSGEYMGDPQPITGGVWLEDDIHFVSILRKYSEYDLAIISVDPAWTTEEDSANTSIIELLRLKQQKEEKRRYVCYNEQSGKFTFDDILKRLEISYLTIKETYPGIRVVVPIEVNGGGRILVDIANSRDYAFVVDILEVKHTRAKEERIMALEVPIKNGTIEFMDTLRDGELIWEILTFPKCKLFDGVDALSMAYVEAEQIKRRNFVMYRRSWY